MSVSDGGAGAVGDTAAGDGRKPTDRSASEPATAATDCAGPTADTAGTGSGFFRRLLSRNRTMPATTATAMRAMIHTGKPEDGDVTGTSAFVPALDCATARYCVASGWPEDTSRTL